VVECDLAKVEVAGSNPVSRSRFLADDGPAPDAGIFILSERASFRACRLLCRITLI
jgi:hypothetical protein